MSASSNAGRASEETGIDPFVITTAGWYTFAHVFRSNTGNTLAVDLKISHGEGTELHRWTVAGGAEATPRPRSG